jgi:hypothetical protein
LFNVGATLVAPVQVGPVGSAAGTTPTYTFGAVAGATGYDIYLYDATTATTVSQISYTPATANCPTNTGNCTVLQATPLAVGNTYLWFVNERVGTSIGPWSPQMVFTP